MQIGEQFKGCRYTEPPSPKRNAELRAEVERLCAQLTSWQNVARINKASAEAAEARCAKLEQERDAYQKARLRRNATNSASRR